MNTTIKIENQITPHKALNNKMSHLDDEITKKENTKEKSRPLKKQLI
jgi:hypothetical protein